MKKYFIAGIIALFVVPGILMADTSILPVKQFDPYAMIKIYYGYHKSSPEAGESELDLNYGLQLNSRIGAKIDIDNIRTQFELGLDSAGSKASLRLAFGVFELGGIRFTVGQNYTPYCWPAIGDYVEDNNIIGFGTSYDGRLPQIKLDKAGFYISFITPGRNTTRINETSTVADTSVLMPKTSIGYDYISGATIAGAGAACNITGINDPAKAYDNEKIISWIGYLHANIDTGSFILRGNFAYGQNTGNFGLYNVTNTDRMPATFASTVYVDSDRFSNTRTIEGYINPQLRATPALLLSCGAGFARADNPEYAEADLQIAYFADIKYDITRNFSIMPSFTFRDFRNDRDGNKQGSEYYAGTQLMVSI